MTFVYPKGKECLITLLIFFGNFIFTDTEIKYKISLEKDWERL